MIKAIVAGVVVFAVGVGVARSVYRMSDEPNIELRAQCEMQRAALNYARCERRAYSEKIGDVSQPGWMASGWYEAVK